MLYNGIQIYCKHYLLKWTPQIIPAKKDFHLNPYLPAFVITANQVAILNMKSKFCSINTNFAVYGAHKNAKPILGEVGDEQIPSPPIIITVKKRLIRQTQKQGLNCLLFPLILQPLFICLPLKLLYSCCSFLFSLL